MSKIRVGLLGYGLSGRVFHIPFLKVLPEFEVTMVWVRTPEAVEKDPSLEGIAVTGRVEDILENSDIDLVVVGVPNTLHFPWALKALESGKHVVVEKPMTITSEEAQILIDTADSNGKILSVYQNRRWDSDFKTVKKLLDEGALGRLVEFESHFDRFRPQVKEAWREAEGPGTGMLYDLGSHLIDQALMLFGMPETLYSDLRIQRHGGKTVDGFELILGYPGLKVTLKSGSLVREPLPRFVALGEKGSFVKFGLDVQEPELKAGKTPYEEDRWGAEPEALWGTLHTELAGSVIRGRVESEDGDYGAYYRQLAEAILATGVPPVSGHQGMQVIQLIELAQKSHELGQRLTLKDWIK